MTDPTKPSERRNLDEGTSKDAVIIDQDPKSAGVLPPGSRRSRGLEAVLTLFVVAAAVSLLWPKQSSVGVLAGRTSDWISLALLLFAAAVNGLVWAKRDRFWLPVYVHFLAGVGLIASAWSVWQDRGLWREAPLYYVGHLLLGPAIVYVVFLAYDGVAHARRKGLHD